ncbi:MAG: hypothetical protein MUP82_01195, partial [Candidatus Marinimicrobia bacterium]|nr:hypothetical protein [Candidatus Neomarinimicrobiota bacterium]
MKNSIVKLFFFLSLIFANNISLNDNQVIFYEVDMTNTKDDLYHVTVIVNGLSKNNDIYNFASNVPGTYQISDFGRFVKSFQAYNKNDKELGTTRLSTNHWRIRNSKEVAKIVYTIEDTYDAVIDSNEIYPMSGTGIQKDFIILNTFGVLGFFDGMQSNPIELDLKYNKKWKIGTSLRK